MDEKIETKINDFINIVGESVTVPKKILDDYLKQTCEVIKSVEGVNDTDFNDFVIKNIHYNKEYLIDIFNTFASDNMDTEYLFNKLHERYTDEEIFYRCVKILVKLNVINKYFNDIQFIPHDFHLKDKIYERELEEYLINHIESIETGMIFIDNQVPHIDSNGDKRGSIDILAKDINNKTCLIELKVVDNDTKLIYQCTAYPSNYKDCRMIIIAPGYSNTILTELNKLKYVEKYIYSIDGIDINTLKINKI